MSCKFDPENPFKDTKSQPQVTTVVSESKGLSIEQFFSTPGIHPFDQLEWESRSTRITSDSGEVIFEQDDIEVPTSWSQSAQRLIVRCSGIASKVICAQKTSLRRRNLQNSAIIGSRCPGTFNM